MAPRKQDKQKPRRMSAKVVTDEDYQLQYERAAGIDVAKDDAAVCLRLPPEPGTARRSSRTWTVPARVPDIEALAQELTAAGVQMISMESTSDYWRIWFAVLEKAGLRVQLVSSSQARNLPGRPKTDAADAAWIARLTEMGMLRSSLVLPPELRTLRVYTREAVRLTADRTRYWNRMEKLLEDALCKLSAVVSGLAKNQSARAMIEAMISGERDPQALASLAAHQMRGKHGDLVRAFTGMQFGDEHAQAAAGCLAVIDLLTAQIAAARGSAAAHLAAVQASWGADADGTTGPDAGRGDDPAVLPAVARLAEIPGVSQDTAIALIAEIGLDMTRFRSPQALVSWTGLAPVPVQSGPKAGRGKKGHGNSYARRVATSAGQGAGNTATFLGERHRRIRQRPGSGGWTKANCAVGRSVLVIVWHLLKDPAARYRDLGPGHYARHADTSRKTRGHIRQLEALGYDVTVTPREAA